MKSNKDTEKQTKDNSQKSELSEFDNMILKALNYNPRKSG